MATYDGLFTYILDKSETLLATAYSGVIDNIFQGPKVINAGFQYPAISIQWTKSSRDQGNRDGWLMFVDYIMILNNPSADMDAFYDEMEVFGDNIKAVCDDINNDDINTWGRLVEFQPGHINNPKKGYLQWVRIQAKWWVGTSSNT